MTTDIDHLTLRIRSLPRTVDPEHDLWPAIEAELTDPESASADAPPVRHWRFAGMAAGFLLVGGLGFWLGTMSMDPTTRAPALQPTLQLGPAMVPASLPRQPDLHATRIALSELVEERLNSLTADSRQVVMENLAAINLALDEIEAALAGHPAPSTEQRLLMAMYTDQLALLEKMNTLVRGPAQEIAI